jgi:tetratricopeptide (TPR) repeat protein
MSAYLANLLVILLGRGPMLLIIAVLYRDEALPFINAWTLWMGGALPLLWLAGIGLAVRMPSAWYAAFALGLLDVIAALVLQLLFPAHPAIPIAMLLINLMILGMLLFTFDEVRYEYRQISLPEHANLPQSAMGAYDAGVAYSKAGLWYFAARMWQRAVQYEHHEGRYRRALGLAYVHLKQYAAAQNELRAALALLPDDAQAQAILQLASDESTRQSG